MSEYEDCEDRLNVSKEEDNSKKEELIPIKNENQNTKSIESINIKKNKILKNKMLKTKIKDETKPIEKDPWDDVLDMHEPLPYNRDEYVPQKHDN